MLLGSRAPLVFSRRTWAPLCPCATQSRAEVRILRLSRMAKLLRAVPELARAPRKEDEGSLLVVPRKWPSGGKFIGKTTPGFVFWVLCVGNRLQCFWLITHWVPNNLWCVSAILANEPRRTSSNGISLNGSTVQVLDQVNDQTLITD